MADRSLSRRDLIKTTAAATAALALALDGAQAKTDSPYDAKGLPTRAIGRTKVQVPRMAIGTGSRFCAASEDVALEILTYALDNGLYYWDTARVYVYDGVDSEARLGKIVKHRRKEIFLSTKVTTRDPEQAKRDIEKSLTLLNTDHLDILKIHQVESVEDVEEMGKKGGLADVVRSYRDQGVTTNVGFSGHNSADAMALAAKRFGFDTMLMALNHYQEGREPFEGHAVPTAVAEGLSVMVMKVIRPRETVKTVSAKDLMRYALSLKGPTGCVIGIDNLDVLKQNIGVLRDFAPMDKQELDETRVALAPFYGDTNLEWMRPGYRDGQLA
jgi:predicted aldo/keto reductase-like oxidoreductase